MRNFSRINKSPPALRLSFKRHPFDLLKILDRNALLGKSTAAIFSVIVDSSTVGPPAGIYFTPQKKNEQ